MAYNVYEPLAHMQVLVVHIARFSYEEGSNSTVKIRCPVHHPLTLDLQPEWFAENAPVKSATYKLVSKVVHKGENLDYQTGHCTSACASLFISAPSLTLVSLFSFPGCNLH